MDSNLKGHVSSEYETSSKQDSYPRVQGVDVGWFYSYQMKTELTSSNLMRIRDFMSLLLTYPMKLDEEDILKSWLAAFSERKAHLLSYGEDDIVMIDKPWLELTEKAFRRMQVFIPMQRIWGRSIQNHVTPEAILPMAVDLAVDQLIQTLFSRDCSARYIRLLTRNLVEKTSVVNKVAAALEEKENVFGTDKDFLRALWIDASTYGTNAEVRVQEEINTMMAVGFPVAEDDDELRAQYIEEKMASNRHLVIVVNANSNKKLDLQQVHFPTGIVVLITTELPTQVNNNDDFRITCMMDLNIRIQDHLLHWQVFCRYVNYSTIRSSSTIQRIAAQIVKECHGHLLAIVLVANYLKHRQQVRQWELALVKLLSLNPSYDYQGSDRIGISRVMVNAFVNIIWEDINRGEKLCLERMLFVHNIKIGVQADILESMFSTLLGHSRGERFAQPLIKMLQDRFVLLNDASADFYVPVETYDIIKSLHTSNPSIISQGALGLTELPYIGRWHGLIRIELMDNEICELPQSPDFPKLLVLLLQGNADLLDIPDSFFDHMPLLQHLDLSYTSIRDLPPSVSKLTQLKKFYLRGCDLFMELPPQIGQLKNLVDFDLDGTLITHLAEEIRELINLQSLTLCFDRYHHLLGYGKKSKQNSNSTIIPPGLISKLTRLSYLSINVDPEDERWNENVVSVLVEIFGLKKLQKVSIYVPKAELLELIPSTRFLNFKLVVGHHVKRFISRVTPELEQKFKNCDYSIKFVNGVNVPNGVKMNLGHFKALYLDRHMTIKSLSDFELRNLSGLQVCILAECNEMETIVDGSYLHDEHALPNLEFLSVFYMKNLRSICESPERSFLHLKSIALHTCPMLTTIFTFESLYNLYFLEEIIIEDCPKVTTLISRDSPEQESAERILHRLRMITLLYLPELVNIFNGLHVYHTLEKMVFYYCPKLQSLSKLELSSKSLKIIKGENKWWEALKWNAAEWGDAGRPIFLEPIFSPINEEDDILTQLAAHQGFMYLPISSSGRLMDQSISQKVVLKVAIYDDKIKEKVMKMVSGLVGVIIVEVDSVSVDMKSQQFTVIGNMDPEVVLKKLRKLCDAEILSVELARKNKEHIDINEIFIDFDIDDILFNSDIDEILARKY
ncbi:disease resistance protein At4g27190 isoform X3 [Cajanus cajan]|uniref:disease resistance protein At4g27190 isoform X3 n=1 Tax=Cajanus cajan TaxID=3821 RepID=UPI0010FBA0A3|nr:disease resistance protein At4g27190 isoform X3 [Cajanus cajan]